MRMLKLATLAGIVTAVVVSAASPAHAGFNFCQIFKCDFNPPTSAPEIDPSMLSGAITVLVGGGLMLAERFRKR